MTLLAQIIAKAEAKEPVGIPAFWHLLNIAKAAREVRDAQVLYFDTRDRSDLIEAKRLENYAEAMGVILPYVRGSFPCVDCKGTGRVYA